MATALHTAPALAASLSGTASIRERIALPPDAVFEAVLIDYALADAAERVLGRVRLQPAGQSPFHFTIPYRRHDLSPNGRYTVRASVRRGERLLFTTDTIKPVLTGGRTPPLNLQLVQVAAASSEAPLQRLTGMFRYMADAASIRLCASGEQLPVAMEADYLRLERAYLRALPPGGAGRPLLATLDGQISLRASAEARQPPTRSLVVRRYVELAPAQGCPQQGAAGGASSGRSIRPSLLGTRSKLEALQPRSGPVPLVHPGRPPELPLDPNSLRLSGQGGCNRLSGSFQLQGEQLRLSQLVSTEMACRAALMALEQR